MKAASGAFATGSMVDLLTVIGTKAAGTAAVNSLLAGSDYNSQPDYADDRPASRSESDANGYLEVNIKAGAGSGGTAMVDEASFHAGHHSIHAHRRLLRFLADSTDQRTGRCCVADCTACQSR